MKKNILTKKDLNFYHKNGYLIVKNFLSIKETILAKKRLRILEKTQKDGRGLSEPGIKKALIHSLHKDTYFINLIEKKKKIFWSCQRNFKCRKHQMLECEVKFEEKMEWKC